MTWLRVCFVLVFKDGIVGFVALETIDPTKSENKNLGSITRCKSFLGKVLL
jgi:hypothetical protein